MSSIFIKRFLIIMGTLVTLLILEVNSSDTLLMNLPSHEDVIQSILDKQKQQEDILKDLENLNDRNPDEDYQNLFDNSIRHAFIIEFTSEEWNGLINDMVQYNAQFGDYRSNEYHKTKVTYVAGDEVLIINDVGFRTKGNIYSRRLPEDDLGNVREVHFMLKFNETFDLEENTDEYFSLKRREVFNIEQLLFKWNNQYDPSYMNEVFAYNMFDQIGVVTTKASFAEVRIVIDGKIEMISFYNIFEHIDEEFIRKHLQDYPRQEVGDLYKVIYPGILLPITDLNQVGIRDWRVGYRPTYGKETNKGVNNYDNLINFTYGLNLSNSFDRLSYLERNFNIDSFIKTMAMTVLLGSFDDYRANLNNYYLYFDEDGYCTYIPFDYDNSMGSGWNGVPWAPYDPDSGAINYTLGNDIHEWVRFPWTPQERPLYDNIIELDDYLIQYENYLMEFIESGIYSVESYESMFLEIELLYGDMFDLYNDKTSYIESKIEVITEQVNFYRSQR